MCADRVAVFVPCYKRPEYTKKLIESVEGAQLYDGVDFYLFDDGSNDETAEILRSAKLNTILSINKENRGLRNCVIDFFEMVEKEDYQYLVKLDNDVTVPQNWLDNLISIFKNTKVDILSPNVVPSDAAYKFGKDDQNNNWYRPSKIVGGLWAMRSHLPKGINFERHSVGGIVGAFQCLNQIILEKEPEVGWAHTITVQDIGHWSGQHPEHIKSEDHAEYSAEVGRRVAW